ncbi:MAG: CapA family protein [Ruminococcaceae bacterium]|nr:CapA family protein [Oscillospiraceae bacterium]
MKRSLALLLAVILILVSFNGCNKKKDSSKPSSLENASKVTDFIIGDITDPDTVRPDLQKGESRVSFLAVGDNIMYHCAFTDAQKRANQDYPEYNFMPIYEEVSDEIAKADISYINQETVMAGKEYGYSDYPCFNTPQHLGDQLIEIGFDVVNVATNHMLDMGSSGLEDTIDYWNSKEEITMIGGYENEEAYLEPCIIEKNGISIALLSYTYSTNGISPSSASEAVVPYIDMETMRKDIRRVHSLADVTMVSVHWGVENSFTPNEEQKQLAQMMCDEGVDVIIGTHPHVLQPIEWFESDDGNRTLCIYSLGDFVAVMTKAANMLGGMAKFDIVKKNGDITIENVIFEPTIHHFGPSYYNSKLYFLRDYTDDLASVLGRDCYGINTSYEGLCDLTRDIIDEEFLPEFLLKTSEE